MPTPEQYAEWAAIADGITAGRDLSTLSEAEKATTMAIRAMGPVAGQAWVQQEAAFMHADAGVIAYDGTNPKGKEVSIESLPPAQRDYYLKIRQQQAQDSLDATAIFARATTASPSSNVPPPAVDADFTPPTTSVIGTMGDRSSGGTLLTTVPARALVNLVPAATYAVETNSATSSRDASTGSSSSVTGTSAAANVTPAVATGGNEKSNTGTIAIVVVVVLLTALALGWISLPRKGG